MAARRRLPRSLPAALVQPPAPQRQLWMGMLSKFRWTGAAANHRLHLVRKTQRLVALELLGLRRVPELQLPVLEVKPAKYRRMAVSRY